MAYYANCIDQQAICTREYLGRQVRLCSRCAKLLDKNHEPATAETANDDLQAVSDALQDVVHTLPAGSIYPERKTPSEPMRWREISMVERLSGIGLDGTCRATGPLNFDDK